jgi:hypothetical protein
MLQRMSVVVRAGVLAVVLAACGLTTTSYPIDSTATTTLIPGWERYFTVEWTAGPNRGGVRRLDGYVYNRYGEYAFDVRLLVQALDSSGKVVSQRVAWGPTGVGGFGRAYFDVGNLPAADHYQVFVWDYRLVQAAGVLP